MKEFPRFESRSAPFSKDAPPLENPEKFLEWLKWHNADQYDYEALRITADQVRTAIDWARSKGIDPRELSPAQIVLSQHAQLAEKEEKRLQEEEKGRVAALEAHKVELKDIFVPDVTTFHHATGSLETVKQIFKEGLLCSSALGLGPTAQSLERVHEQGLRAEESEAVEHKNIVQLAKAHRGGRYQIIIRLPEMTPAQSAQWEEERAEGQKSWTSLYVTELEAPVEVPSSGLAMTSWDAKLDPKYIVGAIDIDTGEFIDKSSTK